MTGIELEALRRLLFFSPPEAATLVSQTSEQAWRRWESGARGVPADVAARVRALADWRQRAIDAAVRQIVGVPDGAAIGLLWYSSLDDWASLPGREPQFWRPQQSVIAALAAEFSSRVNLVVFDGPRYSAWLNGRIDSEAMRASWAGMEN